VEGVVIRALTVTTGIGLQIFGLYAAVVTFGALITLGLYAVGGLAIVLQHVVLSRSTSCSRGGGGLSVTRFWRKGRLSTGRSWN
jgi:hypothetical protein